MHKGQIDLAIAEVEAVVGKGFLRDDFYFVDASYKKEFNRLAFVKGIYNLELSGKKIVKKKQIIDLNKINTFQKRRAHLLPAGHPAMTHPRLARAMVNLSGAKEVLDPFCGGGGILIEAGLCGLNGVGFDIDEKMLERARKNMDYFRIKDYSMKKQDARTFSGSYKAVVTDLPYGKNTKVVGDLEELYLSFLKNIKRNNLKKVVVGFPDFVDYRQLIKQAKLQIQKEFCYYLHRSLSKVVIVLKN